VPTPSGITLTKQSMIVEIVDGDLINIPAFSSPFLGGFVRVIGTEWSADPAPPAIGDYVQFRSDNIDSFQQGAETYVVVPKENYLFIQDLV
jgi:hypothetical protein